MSDFRYVKDAGLRFAGALVPRKRTVRIIEHHTSGGPEETVEGIHAYHLSKKHKGIDYNFCVLADGTVVKGRGLEMCGGSVNNTAPRSRGMNDDSVAIAALGDFERNGMLDAQKEGLMRITRDVAQHYGITQIIKHKDVSDTDCPGRFYPFDEIVAYANGQEEQPQGQYEFALSQLVSTKSGTEDEIRAVQRTLLDLGYELGSAGPDKNGVDGVFGTKTKKAVYAFQRDHRLKEDGVVGENTCEALNGRWDG